MNLIEIIISGIASIITVLLFIFIIWDHIKDDRLLTKNVQIFYDSIENLIFSILQKEYKGKREVGLQLTEYYHQYDYYNEKFLQLFDEFGKYLGLVRHLRRQMQKKKFYHFLHVNKYFLTDAGYLSHSENLLFHLDANKIDQEGINYIGTFLKDLRDYWKKNYSKIILGLIKIRPNLKAKVNFKMLLGFKFPINKE